MTAAYQPNEPQGATCLWWLCYRWPDRIEVVIIEAASLNHARTRAFADDLVADAPFAAEGCELDAEQAALVPRNYVGRVLSSEEVLRLLDRIERLWPNSRSAS